MDYQWLLFCVQLPTTPSGPRVMLWRRMRAVGAASLDNGIWILPFSEKLSEFIQEMQAYVERQAGSSSIFLAKSFDPATETRITDRFRLDRAQEYFEIREQCHDFLAEIEKETLRQNFSFAEYEENEQDLEKLQGWLEKVRQRDFMGGEESGETSGLLEKCRLALQEFANAVFDREGTSGSDISGAVPPE